MNNSGVSDIIRDVVNGCLADNLKELSYLLQDLIEKPNLRTSFAVEAIGGLSGYDWNRICEQTIRIYTGVIYKKNHNRS